ncbi:MAG: MlaD family protein [Phenylobacterium sp.]|jgi:phospholipid/cholesterol/gamma-HCH transport system substrate-binding protein|uniref:MlaD family protein n=1 Tax=Phenylobacterium sp. TaxID=1871053 RepID=UPI003919246D
MEKDANYALVGLSTLILIVGLLIFVVWLGRWTVARDYTVYDIVFQGPVRGLSQGGEVHFNGIKVGEVTRIQLDRTNPNNVIATARMGAEVPVRTDSFATLEPQGVTGVNYIQITAGTPSARLLKDVTPDDKVPVIRSQRSTLSDLLEGGGTVLTRTVEALDRINRVLSDQNIRTFTAALNDAQAVTAELRERKAIVADAQKALQSIDAAAAEIALLAKNGNEIVDGDGRRTMKSVADAAEEAQAAARDIRLMMGKLERPVGEFATTGLPELTAAASALAETAESLDRLVRQLEANPRALIGKPPARELEVQP